jgi:hypothetical protein
MVSGSLLGVTKPEWERDGGQLWHQRSALNWVAALLPSFLENGAYNMPLRPSLLGLERLARYRMTPDNTVLIRWPH